MTAVPPRVRPSHWEQRQSRSSLLKGDFSPLLIPRPHCLPIQLPLRPWFCASCDPAPVLPFLLLIFPVISLSIRLFPVPVGLTPQQSAHTGRLGHVSSGRSCVCCICVSGASGFSWHSIDFCLRAHVLFFLWGNVRFAVYNVSSGCGCDWRTRSPVGVWVVSGNVDHDSIHRYMTFAGENQVTARG